MLESKRKEIEIATSAIYMAKANPEIKEFTEIAVLRTKNAIGWDCGTKQVASELIKEARKEFEFLQSIMKGD
jgi:hypothetical protein